MARPSGDIRKYTVHCIWPSTPGVWREAVALADEKTARASVEALRRMHYAVQVTITFQRANTVRTVIEELVSARWDRYGVVTYRHEGGRQHCIPAWALGQKEEKDDRGTRIPGARRRDRRSSPRSRR